MAGASDRASALAALAWPSTSRGDLLFPALGLPSKVPRRCLVKDGGQSPPPWLVEATDLPLCTVSLRGVVGTDQQSGEGGDATRPQDLLTAAAVCDDAVTIRRLLASGADASRQDSCGLTALVAAASAGASHAVDELLAAGANPNFSSRQGPWSRPPLIAALIRADVAIAKALLRAGANGNAQTPARRSALMFAAATGDQELVGDLLQRRASACHRDDLGLDALAVARAHGASETVATLKKAEARCENAAGEPR